MKRIHLSLLALLIPLMGLAQKNELINKSKTGKKSKYDATQQVFIFPDNIKLNKQALNEKVVKKTQALTKYIQKLAGNKNGNYMNEINEAMKLFNNDERKLVTVTRKNNQQPVTMPVREYLNNLAKLHYDHVSILWRNAEYVSNFTKQPDGTYAALAAFEQEFAGVKAGEAYYTYYDITQKKTEVIVKVWDAKNEKALAKSYVDVFLGNIGIVED